MNEDLKKQFEEIKKEISSCRKCLPWFTLQNYDKRKDL